MNATAPVAPDESVSPDATTQEEADANIYARMQEILDNSAANQSADVPPALLDFYSDDIPALSPAPGAAPPARGVAGFDVAPSAPSAPAAPEGHDGTAQVLAMGLLFAAATVFIRHYGWRRLEGMMRRRAALVICAGAALVAITIFLGDRGGFGSRTIEDYIDDGFVALFGALLALVGVYHWVAGTNNEI